MDDLKIRLVLEGADQVQAGATKAADGLKRFGETGQKAGQQVQLSGQQMAQVSAQLQDLFVQIQGGQAPLTALLQQGSQLSAVFGGFGNAARAVASLVSPTVAVLGGLAVGVGALAKAYFNGAAEAQAYGRALVFSGSAAGVTIGQLQSLARAQAALVGTQGDAAAALAALAATGKVTAANLGSAADAAVRLQRVGVPLEETAKKFAALGKDPVKALIDLNEAENFLTTAVYSQVKALQEQGRVAEAASVAQEALAKVAIDRAKALEGQLGFLQSAWIKVGDYASKAWDRMLNLGRPVTAQDQLEKVQKQLDALDQTFARQSKPLFGSSITTASQDQAALERRRAALQEQADALRETLRLESRSINLKTEAAERERARIKWLEEADKYQSKQQQAEQEIARIRNEGAKAGATQLEIDQRIAAVRAKAADTSGDNELAGLRAKLKETNAYIEALSRQDASTRQLNEGERAALKLREELQTTLSGTTRAEKERALVLADQLGARQRLAEGLKSDIENNQRLTAELYQQTDATRQRAIDQAAANAVLGKGRTAIEEMTLAQLRKSAADLEATDNVDPKYLAGLYARIEAQKLYIDTLKQTDYKTLAAGLDEWMRTAEEQRKLFESEQGLTGLTRLEREKVVAARATELKLAKELANIDKAELDDAQKEALRLKARAAARVESEAATAKVVRDEWARTSDQIEQSLTDALLRGFESGKSFAANLRDTLANMFKTLVLRPIIQPIVSQAAGGIASLLGFSGNARASAGGGSSGALGTASNLASLLGYGGFGSAFSGGFGLTMSGAGGTGLALQGAGSLFGNGAYAQGLSQGAGALAPWALGAAAGIYGGRAISGGYSAVGGSGNTAVNVGTAIGAIWGPLGAAIGGAIGGLVNRAFGMKAREARDSGITGTASASGFAGQAFADWVQKGGWFRSDRSGTDFSAVDAQQESALDSGIQTLYKTTSEYAKVLGLPVEAVQGYAASFKVVWGKTEEENQKAIQDAFVSLGEQLASRYAAQLAPLQKTGETISATLQRLATLQTFSSSLNSLGGVFSRLASSSVSAREQMIGLVGGMDALSQQALSFAQNYYSREEIAGLKAREVQAGLQQAGFTADLSSREQFRALVESLNPTTADGQKQLAALLQLQSSFAAVADYLTETGLSLSQAAAQAPVTDALTSPLLAGVSQQLQLAQQSMDAQYETRDATLQVVDAITKLGRDLLGAAQSGGSALVPGYRQPEVQLAY